MSSAVSRSALTLLGLVTVAAAVLVAAVTAPDHDLPTAPPASSLGDPCSYMFDLQARESRLVWFFGQTDVPSGLIEASSGAANYCQSGFSAQGGERDYSFAVTFVFLEGEGEAREEAVWWLFYPTWDDPIGWGAQLRRESGGEVAYYDGYIVAISPNASDETRRAAASAPDTDAWSMWFESTSDLR